MWKISIITGTLVLSIVTSLSALEMRGILLTKELEFSTSKELMEKQRLEIVRLKYDLKQMEKYAQSRQALCKVN